MNKALNIVMGTWESKRLKPTALDCLKRKTRKWNNEGLLKYRPNNGHKLSQE